MDDAIMFSDSFSFRLILDTYRSDQFTIVKSVGEHQPSLSPSPKFFVRFSLPPGISMSGLEKNSLIFPAPLVNELFFEKYDSKL